MEAGHGHPSSVSEEEHDHPKNHGPIFTPFQGFWFLPQLVPNIISFQKHFQALDDDIIVASMAKAGTTWLKALVFAVVNRTRYTLLSESPLNTATPHQLVQYFEMTLFNEDHGIPDLATIPSPRLFSTHLPYSVLAQSIKQSNARIVYVTRNPLDVIVSFWHFLRSKPEHANWPFEECFESCCRGEEYCGPFWDHVLGYWKEGLEKPNKILFLRYEDMKRDPTLQIKRIAEFLGLPFSMEEERDGVIKEIARFCSFSNLKNLEVNKTGRLLPFTPDNKHLFGKGEVSDHINYLTPSAIERYGKILEEKLSGSGLAF
ncbi:hypothetical protein QUC31_006007 [Theobroma cacao]